MNVTKNVILDLLPLYLDGEASADTAALVAEFFERHPELEGELMPRESHLPVALEGAELPPEAEMRALRRTKRMVSLRSALMAFAIFATCLAVGFEFNDGGTYWLPTERPVLSAVLGAVGLTLWIGYFSVRRRLRSSGL